MSNAEDTNVTNTKLNNKSSDFNRTKGGKFRLESITSPDFKSITNNNFTRYKSQIIKNVRLLGMSEYQSSSTLQNSIYSWTFPRTHRFKDAIKEPSVHTIYNLPRLSGTRSTNFGYGVRKVFEDKKDNPPPNSYSIPTVFDTNILKKKGISLNGKINPLTPVGINFPSPDRYNVRKDNTWKRSIQIKIKPRLGIFYDDDLMKTKHCISPQSYLPDTKIVENNRFRNISVSFGKGVRSSNANPWSRDVPGPGHYEPVSVFDKNRKIRPPLN